MIRSAALRQPRTHAIRREEARNRIVDAAIEIVAERGLDELTLAEAGEVAGYSRGLAAHYFGSKDELTSQIAEQIVSRYREVSKLAGLKGAEGKRSQISGVLATIQLYLEDGQRAPQILRALHIVLGAAISKPELAASVAKLNRDNIAIFAQQIEAGINAGEIRRDVDPEGQAALILAGLRGLVAQWLVDPKQIDLTRAGKEFAATVKRRLTP